MKLTPNHSSYLTIIYFLIVVTLLTSCVTKRDFSDLKSKYNRSQTYVLRYGAEAQEYKDRLSVLSMSSSDMSKKYLENEFILKNKLDSLTTTLNEQKINSSKLSDNQPYSTDNLIFSSKEVNANVDKILSQLGQNEKYNNLSNAPQTRADSLNVALGLNLKKAVVNSIEDPNVEVEVDKTVVMVNLTEKMLFSSGSSKLSPKANAILEKIAQLVKSRPELEVIVEGYTDNVANKTGGIKDNWDLSVKRATSVVRVLQETFHIDPNKLIAAGRGQYNRFVSSSLHRCFVSNNL